MSTYQDYLQQALLAQAVYASLKSGMTAEEFKSTLFDAKKWVVSHYPKSRQLI